MTGQDIQDKLNQIVSDLQTTAKGKQTQIAVRNQNGALAILPLSSDANGVVDALQLAEIQSALDDWKTFADTFETESVPVKIASEAFREARAVHQPLIDAATSAREALNTALEQDGEYQSAKTDYDTAKEAPSYVSARDNYQAWFVSENYGNLSDARGTYI